MSNTPAKNEPIFAAPLPPELARLHELCKFYAIASRERSMEQAKLEHEFAALIARRSEYLVELEAAANRALAGIEDLVFQNPGLLGEKRSLKTPHGTVKLMITSKLVVANEADTLNRLLLRAKRVDSFDASLYYRDKTELDLEALEKLDDVVLGKLGVRRETGDLFKFTLASSDLKRALADAARPATTASAQEGARENSHPHQRSTALFARSGSHRPARGAPGTLPYFLARLPPPFPALPTMKTITTAQYQQLIGLLALAEKFDRQLDLILDSCMEITREDGIGGHTSDAVYNPQDRDVDQMLTRLNLKVSDLHPFSGYVLVTLTDGRLVHLHLDQGSEYCWGQLDAISNAGLCSAEEFHSVSHELRLIAGHEGIPRSAERS